ncbi:alpha-glucosidase [Pedobacter westerhofensis]|uniref:Alpha-glucosidase n=1 Tax=Pedobacter westerhofensis TaxID=425512 RepID=A0A521FRD0_9SPHI|nr:glycoside hydrolase family 97 protein [Pedobacter westerhofensis]SMO98692.1 alpha-glucosidase [Pedobacter westerhofensis]
MNKLVKLMALSLIMYFNTSAKDYIIMSPNKKNMIKISVDKKISWSVFRNNQSLIANSPMSMSLGNGQKLGASPEVLKTEMKKIDRIITAIVPVRNKYIPEVYNEIIMMMKGNYSLEFRAYNDGVAYRFVTAFGKQFIDIKDEEVTFNFSNDCQVYLPKEDNPELQSHYEAEFQPLNLKDISSKTYGYLPLYISSPTGVKMVVTESDLEDYPNLFLFGTGNNILKGKFPKVILKSKIKDNSDRNEEVVEKADYHAKTMGNRTFPWRAIVIGSSDKELLESELVYKLAKPNVLKETAWIKPGKVAWDWWNDNNIYGVNFKSGINTDTYKYYIDFASDYGLEYIILDEGWSRTTTDLMEPNPQLDLQELVRYATRKKVGVILWALWKPLDQNMEGILDQYVKWGIKGVKVDFMARADQYMVNFYKRVAEATARHKLLLDLHGAYKPVGLNRQYPNVVNYEGVKGMEQNKWEASVTPVHNTTLPFTRMVAGPMDFTPGAMLNSNKDEFHINFHSPMSRGTRAHQAAMYVVYDSPLQMLCDNPSNYRAEPIYTRYISRFPTVWDKTIALEGKIGEYVVVARKKGKSWYLGGMTDWTARTFQVPLDFLDKGKYKIEILKDGINVDKHAADYRITVSNVNSGEVLSLDMAAGGGYTAILTLAN